MMRRAAASQRFVIWIAAMFASVVLPIWSAIPRVPAAPSAAVFHLPAISGPHPAFGHPLPAPRGEGSRSVDWLFIGYSAFVAWRALMLGRAWWKAALLRRNATLTARRGSAFGLSGIAILSSNQTATPITLGFLAPAIIVPSALPEHALDAAIAHEMAHIRRRDFIVNLMIEIVSLPIAFHPAAALIKRRIAQARELACDEMVSPDLIPPREYAMALVAVAAREPDYSLAMARGDVEYRVRNIVSRKTVARMPATIAAITMVAATAAAATLAVHPELPFGNATERAAAACAAGRARNESAIPMLVSMLSDDTPIEALPCYSGTWTPARAIFDHASPGEQAALALASISEPSVPSLVAALNDRSAVTRRNAAWAIGETRGGHHIDRGAALDPLITLLADRDPSVRRAAAFGLSELRSDNAVDALIATLADADSRVRGEVAVALGEIANDRASGALLSVGETDPDPNVRRAARWALREVEDKR
jgi:HEAT repeat protein